MGCLILEIEGSSCFRHGEHLCPNKHLAIVKTLCPSHLARNREVVLYAEFNLHLFNNLTWLCIT
jgi:hypothetical protein